jgi:hypothetical protein
VNGHMAYAMTVGFVYGLIIGGTLVAALLGW